MVMKVRRRDCYVYSVLKESKHYHCQQRDEWYCKEKETTQEIRKRREGVSRRVAVEDGGRCMYEMAKREYRIQIRCSSVCGVVAAH